MDITSLPSKYLTSWVLFGVLALMLATMSVFVHWPFMIVLISLMASCYYIIYKAQVLNARSLSPTLWGLKLTGVISHSIMMAIPDGLIVIDRKGHINLVNPAAELIFGFESGSLVQKSIEVVIPHFFQHYKNLNSEVDIDRANSNVVGIGYEVIAKKFDGKVFPVEINIGSMSGDNEYANYILVVRDITERKVIEYEVDEYQCGLEKSNSELEEFSYLAAHDLKDPLRKINYYTSKLIDSRCISGECFDFVNKIQKSQRWMSVLLDSLLDYAHTCHALNLNEEVDLNSIIDGIINEFSDYMLDSKARIIVKDLPVIQGDQVKLCLLFRNLISNALKYSSDKRLANIEIFADSFENTRYDHCSIHVKDNGIGIDEKHLNKIFLPFKRLVKGQSGSGLGLSICSKIVKMHHGDISVNSSEGEGSDFIVRIPVLQHDIGRVEKAA